MASNVTTDDEEGSVLQPTSPSSLEDRTVPSRLMQTGRVTKPSLTVGWQTGKPLDRCMLQMFDAQLWTDVMFRCGNQAPENFDDRVRAHRIILAARSPVFQAMFFGPCKDTNAEVEIQDSESEHFEMFLRLLYSDDLDPSDKYDDLLKILALAHKYQVQVVVDGCSRKLTKQISVDNACTLLEIAFLYDNDYLIKATSDFIDQNAEDVLLTDGFFELSLRYLTYILKGNTFCAKEDDIFNCVIEWARRRCNSADGQVLRETLGDAFYYLRTPTMTKREFIMCTKKRGYYSPDDYERIISTLSNPDASVEEITCNSTIPRRPLECTLRRPKQTLSHSNRSFTKEYKRCLSETISITVNDDIVLTDINLKSISHGKVGDKECTLIDTPLSVTITVNDGEVHSSTHTLSSRNSSSKVHFSQPIAMSPGQSYELNVTVEQGAIQDMYLRNDRYTDEEKFEGCKDVSMTSVKQVYVSNRLFGYNAINVFDSVIEYISLKFKSKRN